MEPAMSILCYLKLAGNHSWTSSQQIIALYACNGPSAEPFEPIFSAFPHQVTINLFLEDADNGGFLLLLNKHLLAKGTTDWHGRCWGIKGITAVS